MAIDSVADRNNHVKVVVGGKCVQRLVFCLLYSTGVQPKYLAEFRIMNAEAAGLEEVCRKVANFYLPDHICKCCCLYCNGVQL
jgi:hypothetical protein